MTVSLRRASPDDSDVLSGMNRALIQDEGSPSTLTLLELSERMRRWLLGGWTGLLILIGEVVIGYALFQERRDEAHIEVYIRQFYIKPPFRRRGLGREAFEQMQVGHFPPGAPVVLDVLATNPGARHFWEKLGFRSYAEPLRLERRG